MSPYRERPEEARSENDISFDKAIVLVVVLIVLLVGLVIINRLCERQYRGPHAVDGIEISPPHTPSRGHSAARR
jgi:hypothetical protein